MNVKVHGIHVFSSGTSPVLQCGILDRWEVKKSKEKEERGASLNGALAPLLERQPYIILGQRLGGGAGTGDVIQFC